MPRLDPASLSALGLAALARAAESVPVPVPAAEPEPPPAVDEPAVELGPPLPPAPATHVRLRYAARCVSCRLVIVAGSAWDQGGRLLCGGCAGASRVAT